MVEGFPPFVIPGARLVVFAVLRYWASFHPSLITLFLLLEWASVRFKIFVNELTRFSHFGHLLAARKSTVSFSGEVIAHLLILGFVLDYSIFLFS